MRETYSNNKYIRKFLAKKEESSKSFSISVDDMDDLDDMAEKVEETKQHAAEQIEEEKRDFIKEIQEQSKKVKESYDAASKYIESLRHLRESFKSDQVKPDTASETDDNSDSVE